MRGWRGSAPAAPAGGPRGRRGAADPQQARWQRGLRAGRRWAAWGALAGLALGVLTQAPAQWAADALARASGGQLLLAEARGSLWAGSARLVLTGGPDSRDASSLPGRLHWTLRPAWTGLALQARHDRCLPEPVTLQLQPAWGGWTLRLPAPGAPAAPGQAPAPADTALGQWPTAWLSGLGTPWNTLQLGGALQLGSPGLALQSAGGRLRLDGTLWLELRDVSSRLAPLPVLGSYRVELAGQGDAPTLRLHTLGGALQLSGQGQWTGARLRFRGEARAAAGQEGTLANLLNIIGRRQGALSVISIG